MFDSSDVFHLLLVVAGYLMALINPGRTADRLITALLTRLSKQEHPPSKP